MKMFGIVGQMIFYLPADFHQFAVGVLDNLNHLTGIFR